MRTLIKKDKKESYLYPLSVCYRMDETTAWGNGLWLE